MRQAYVVHVLDHVLKERHQVHLNDMALAREELPEEALVNVGNVFKIAKQLEGGEESNEDSHSDDGKEDSQPLQTTEMIKSDRVKQALITEMPPDARQD